MIIYLCGPDSYRRQQKLKDIINGYNNKHSKFSAEHFRLEKNEDFSRLEDFNKNRSLFDILKLGIVSGIPYLEKADKKELINILKSNLDNKDAFVLINEEKRLDKEFNFLLKKPVLSQEFNNLASGQLKKFLQKEAEKRDLNLDESSQDLLIRAYGENVWGMITELDKLALLDKKEITAELLKGHSDLSLLTNIYSLIHEMRTSRKVSRRLSILEQLLIRNVDPGMIFNMLSSFLKEAKEKKEAADYDALVKSGKLEYPEVIFSFVLR